MSTHACTHNRTTRPSGRRTATPGRAALAFTAAAVLFAAALFVTALFAAPLPASAATVPTANADSGDAPAASEQKVVRVGFFGNNPGYQNVDENGLRSGWGYEYLQTLSYYTGWKYEYVYGNFQSLMSKLSAGEIDLMTNISYTPERAQTLLYSANPQGKERYYIYARPDAPDYVTGEPSTLNGKKIGAIPDISQTTAGIAWLDSHGIDYDLVEYGDSDLLFRALASGEIDALILNDTIGSTSAAPVFYVGESDYYLTVPKSRPDLMADINVAMTQIQSANPRYNDEVKTRYALNGGTSSLSAREKTWLAQHKNKVVLGYIDGLLPYSNQSGSGELEGALAELVDELRETFEIEVETRAYTTNTQLNEALDAGKVDAAAPVAKNLNRAENANLIQSNSFATTAAVVVYRGDSLDNALQTIASYPGALINAHELEDRYPSAQVLSLGSLTKCADAVAAGRAGSAVIPLTALDTFRDASGVDDLKTAQLPGSVELSVWMKKGDASLMSIVDKGIANAQDKIIAATLSHYSYDEDESTLLRFIRRHQTAIGVVVIVGLSGFVVLLAALLRRARSAEARAIAASNAKSSFLARMSHDFRTPLNGIVGLLEISNKHPGDLKLAADNRAKARVAADHLLSLVNDVLEMSRLEDGKVVLEHKSFNLRELMDEVEVITRLRAEDRGVTLSTDHGAGISRERVLGSPVHVRRVLLNLVDNCVKYNKPEGSVTCSSQTVEDRDGHVAYRFVISDTGIGMSEEFQKRIFEPFAQENDGARSTYQGTGMGMPIVKAIVEQMGGRIEVQSELGVGSTFTVTLPFDVDPEPEASEAAEAQAESTDVDIAGMNILLAEDNDLNAEIACALLAEERVTVTRAADGREAAEVFCAKPAGAFDAILMDIMMPELDGYEATRVIRTSGKKDALTIPIIAMTANAFAEDVARAHEAGMNDHIAKPIDVKKVKAALAAHRE